MLPRQIHGCSRPPTGFHDHITVSPDKRSGQPSIRGIPITVKDTPGRLAAGMAQEQILKDIPEMEA
ncbi:DUF433 domain-containing protein [Akkermansiaceae bacterium]|nr:DUF433 domain-containing protein [Akkermansiaceae bacterium]